LTLKLSIQEAAKEMKNVDTGFLPIGKDDKLVGTITDRDIVVRCIAKGSGKLDFLNKRISSICLNFPIL
jgi:CBS domain-containing protein